MVRNKRICLVLGVTAQLLSSRVYMQNLKYLYTLWFVGMSNQ